MPQMSPMDWLMLFFYFLFIYYLVLLMIYFLMSILFKDEVLINMNNLKFNFSW